MIHDLAKYVKSIEDKEEIKAAAAKIVYEMKATNKSLHEVVGVQEGLLEQLYSMGYSYYNQGKYTEAVSLFHMVANLNPNSYKYLFAVGSAFHQLKDYPNASYSFLQALTLEPFNPIPAYHLTDCLRKMNDNQGALEMATLAIQLAGDNREYTAIKSRCNLIKENLLKILS